MDEDFVCLQHPSVNAVESIRVNLDSQGEHSREYLSDLVRRCQGPLQQVSISSEGGIPLDINMLSPWGHYPSSTSSTPSGSSLTSVRLYSLCITWEGFSTFLRESQRLKKVDLSFVRFAGKRTEVSTIESSVERLEAPVPQVMEGTLARPTLFDYFPLLKQWTVPTTNGVYPGDLDASLLRREINRYCPGLKRVRFDYADGPVVSTLFAEVFTGLNELTLYYADLTSDVLLDILRHQDTLTLVDPTSRCRMDDMFGYAATMLHLIPRRCRQLQVLSIRGYSADIEGWEEGKWSCEDLQELRLDALKTNRHRQDVIQEAVEGTTIADRVVRRLLPLDHLKVVCLGTKNYYLASL
ncbi:hypothetical protein BGX29_006586 [Mortierella sp. GBA35]|nr:hypothetical protein BGX29_006586 [Mortierella sp. GBA35]